MEFDEEGRAAAASPGPVRSKAEALAAFPILGFFRWGHLPPALQAVWAPLSDVAWRMAATLPICPETTAGLRKLLEAKDCFVRAALPPDVRE